MLLSTEDASKFASGLRLLKLIVLVSTVTIGDVRDIRPTQADVRAAGLVVLPGQPAERQMDIGRAGEGGGAE